MSDDILIDLAVFKKLVDNLVNNFKKSIVAFSYADSVRFFCVGAVLVNEFNSLESVVAVLCNKFSGELINNNSLDLSGFECFCSIYDMSKSAYNELVTKGVYS